MCVEICRNYGTVPESGRWAPERGTRVPALWTKREGPIGGGPAKVGLSPRPAAAGRPPFDGRLDRTPRRRDSAATGVDRRVPGGESE